MLRPTLLAISSLALACVDPTVDDEAVQGAAVTVPSRGAADTFDVGEWNLEWFGSTGQGPSNEPLQLANIRDVIRGADLDLWAVEEVVAKAQFDSLVAQLPGYEGFLANDPRVTSGSSFYSTGEQKVGVIFKSSVVAVTGARLALTAQADAFAGRPPLELDVTVTVAGTSRTFTVLVLHAKALSDVASYNRRVAGSNALKSYLDSSHPNDRVMLLGDINDDLDVSISGGRPSPYKNFVDDTDYRFPTKVFSENNQRTTVSGSQPIDHHLITNDVVPMFVTGSAEVFRVDAFITSYGSTTTDHFPTLTRYSLGTAPPVPSRVILNEVMANEPGSDTAAEFVELVNTGGTAVALGGFTLSDAVGVRHTFAAGTSLAAGKALVVFGGAASSGTLGLNNGGDTVALRDGGGAAVDSVTYTSALGAVDGVSMNRNPDGLPAGVFVLHSVLGGASSPGTRADGSAF